MNNDASLMKYHSLENPNPEPVELTPEELAAQTTTDAGDE
jgi:hypothetical protein